MLSDTLFVYGTLHPHRAPAEIAAVVRGFRSLGRGSVRGRIHQFTEYPALRLEPDGERVSGEIFRVPPGAWRALDAYEGYNPLSPASSLFLRERTKVRMEDASVSECWVYTYARAFP